VKKNGQTIATYVYDGDNNRVKGTVGGVTTAYVGAYFGIGVPSAETISTTIWAASELPYAPRVRYTMW
jgi:hypothetical protein